MPRLAATYRIAIGLTMLSASALLVSRTLHVGPDEQRAVMKGRRELCETLAIEGSLLLSKGDSATFEQSLSAVLGRYPEILSTGVRRRDGQLVIDIGAHSANWVAGEQSTQQATQVMVPLLHGGRLWGTLEFRFEPFLPPGVVGMFHAPLIQLVLVVTFVNLITFLLYLKRTLQHLDPSKVIPGRVQTTLDTVAGGLVILDHKERIVLANRAFAAALKALPNELQGKRLSQLAWQSTEGEQQDGEPSDGTVDSHPWRRVLATGNAVGGMTVRLASKSGESRSYIIHCSPIGSQETDQHGVLVSLDDVTELENKKSELARTLDVLRTSRDEIRAQNHKLQQQATHDPLTNCLNRRSFYESLEVQWHSSQRYGYPLGCVVVDIDHFKAVNDQHGHSTGDTVLSVVAKTLRAALRPGDVICRYGGEEFCVLLPHTDLEHSRQAGERLRLAIKSLKFPELSVTISAGVASSEQGAGAPHDMINQADTALYAAKRNGRDRVTTWSSKVQEELGESRDGAPDDSRQTAAAELTSRLEVPFHAVTALISALAYRDAGTAEHSRRVADLCVGAAQDLLSARDCYVLETAALLHDIGKIGVPDAILLKPGPLSDDEWAIMGVHDRVGIEIIDSAFSCPPLTEIVRNHHAWYEGNPREPHLPTGKEIPIGARLLAIADAYDAIVSDRVYRRGKSRNEAIAELRRCQGIQFDPELVEQFVTSLAGTSEIPSSPGVSRSTAIQIGQQIERLADALDRRDLSRLGAVAGHLFSTAEEAGESELAGVARQLSDLANEDAELLEVARLTTDLMSLCRATQGTFLNRSVNGRAEAGTVNRMQAT